MNVFLCLLTFSSVILVHGQQSDKGTSMIPFPRIGRADPRLFADGKRDGNGNGLIPFPRIGRAEGFQEMKRQLIPFPRVGKRPYWRIPLDFEEYTFPLGESSVPGRVPDMVFEPSEDTEGERRHLGNKNGGGVWFGSRFGRKKRSIESQTSHERDSIDSRLLLKILHNFNWAIVPIKERRTFTPRLGRAYSGDGESHFSSEPYTPRLGRSHEAVLAGEELGMSQRHRRDGTNEGRNRQPKGQEDTNVGGAPFSPRLGRDHINPRLGRSSLDEHE